MLYALHRIFDHFGWSEYQKKSVLETSILELPRLEYCITRLCPRPQDPPRHPPDNGPSKSFKIAVCR